MQTVMKTHLESEAQLFAKLDQLEQIREEMIRRGEPVPLAMIDDICEVLELINDFVTIDQVEK